MAEKGHMQKQILYKALKSPVFAKDVLTKIPLSVFESNKMYKEIAGIIRNYYRTNSEILEEQRLNFLVSDKLDRQGIPTEEQERWLEEVSDLYLVRQKENDTYIDEELDSFIKSSMTRDALMKAASKLDDTKTMNKLVEDLRKITIMDTTGVSKGAVNIIDNTKYVEMMLNSFDETVLSTGFKEVDAIGGSIGKGELGLVMGVSGNGKTLNLINIATNYTRRGLNVLFVELEEKENRMTLKLNQALFRQTRSTLMTGSTINYANYEKIQNFVRKHRKNFGNLYLERHAPQQVSPAKLDQIISDLIIREGQKIDVVIVDYPELMRNPFETGNETKDGELLYQELRRIASEYDVAMWVASQMNRGATQAQVKERGNIEGSYRKINSVDAAFTINQSPEEYRAGFIRWYADKLRNPPEGVFDRMIGFKVEGAKMLIRDYANDEERMEHQAILDSIADTESAGYQKRKRESAPKVDITGSMNQYLSQAMQQQGGGN